MAPTATAFAGSSSTSPLQHLTRSLSLLLARSSTDLSSVPPLASLFALIVRQNGGVVPRFAARDLSARSRSSDALSGMDIFRPMTLSKRQNYILAIPTTYQGLNDGPEPGVVAGITLGAIAGFVLILFLVLSLLRLYQGRTVVREKVIINERRSNHNSHHHHHRQSRSRSRSMSERPQRTRREKTTVEERVTRERNSEPTEVIVEEEHDDIVEVIEEHSPERRPNRKESKRTSGFRTVDPAEFGGGSRPVRKVSRR